FRVCDFVLPISKNFGSQCDQTEQASAVEPSGPQFNVQSLLASLNVELEATQNHHLNRVKAPSTRSVGMKAEITQRPSNTSTAFIRERGIERRSQTHSLNKS
ncbi:MAG: hypothetical protein ACI814_001376, partial [Mariniblastus sp.]